MQPNPQLPARSREHGRATTEQTEPRSAVEPLALPAPRVLYHVLPLGHRDKDSNLQAPGLCSMNTPSFLLPARGTGFAGVLQPPPTAGVRAPGWARAVALNALYEWPVSPPAAIAPCLCVEQGDGFAGRGLCPPTPLPNDRLAQCPPPTAKEPDTTDFVQNSVFMVVERVVVDFHFHPPHALPTSPWHTTPENCSSGMQNCSLACPTTPRPPRVRQLWCLGGARRGDLAVWPVRLTGD
jgi:hypothetical protein